MHSPSAIQTQDHLHPARWWEMQPDGRVHCYLCPRHCRLRDGQAGYCAVRVRRGGRLFSSAYACPSAVHVDPIEKKPLYHFLPGTDVLSLGSAGCNLGCLFCQNWELSRASAPAARPMMLSPDEVVRLAVQHRCPSIAFTYNEPTIGGEYVVDSFRAARRQGLRTVMVTNGYVSREAFHDLYDLVDAVNVDLKSFRDDFYRRYTFSRLEPVLDTLLWLTTETAAWVEITHLMIPGLNDDPAETRRLCDWIVHHVGPDVPVHFTAFHPDYRMKDHPATPPGTLREACGIARDAGIRFAYEGNVRSDGSNTACPACGALLVRRGWHEVLENWIEDARCPGCRQPVPGRWGAAGPLRAGERGSGGAGTVVRARRHGPRKDAP